MLPGRPPPAAVSPSRPLPQRTAHEEDVAALRDELRELRGQVEEGAHLRRVAALHAIDDSGRLEAAVAESAPLSQLQGRVWRVEQRLPHFAPISRVDAADAAAAGAAAVSRATADSLYALEQRVHAIESAPVAALDARVLALESLARGERPRDDSDAQPAAMQRQAAAIDGLRQDISDLRSWVGEGGTSVVQVVLAELRSKGAAPPPSPPPPPPDPPRRRSSDGGILPQLVGEIRQELEVHSERLAELQRRQRRTEDASEVSRRALQQLQSSLAELRAADDAEEVREALEEARQRLAVLQTQIDGADVPQIREQLADHAAKTRGAAAEIQSVRSEVVAVKEQQNLAETRARNAGAELQSARADTALLKEQLAQEANRGMKTKLKVEHCQAQLELLQEEAQRQVSEMKMEVAGALHEMREGLAAALDEAPASAPDRPTSEESRLAAAAVAEVSDVRDEQRAEAEAANYAFVTGDELQAQMGDFAGRLIKWYREKPGDVLDEMVENLRFPPHCRDESATVRALAEAVASKPGISEEYSDLSPIELVVLRSYTQHPVDVDRDLGWPDAPPARRSHEPPGVLAARKDYESKFTDWNWAVEKDGVPCRNGSLFGPVCAAMRDQGPGGDAEQWSEGVLRRWIKWACCVAAVCWSDSDAEAPDLWRGLGGGALPASVVDRHRSLKDGALLGWPSKSSTSFDQTASREYMMGVAANSTSQPTEDRPGTILFRIKAARTGRQLQAISQYPAEAELLFGPLTLFRVDSVAEEPANPFKDSQGRPYGLNVVMTCLGPLGKPLSATPALADFFAEVRADARAASERLFPPAPSVPPSASPAALLLPAEDTKAEMRAFRASYQAEVDEIRARVEAGDKRVADLERAAADLAEAADRAAGERRAFVQRLDGSSRPPQRSPEDAREAAELRLQVQSLAAELQRAASAADTDALNRDAAALRAQVQQLAAEVQVSTRSAAMAEQAAAAAVASLGTSEQCAREIDSTTERVAEWFRAVEAEAAARVAGESAVEARVAAAEAECSELRANQVDLMAWMQDARKAVQHHQVAKGLADRVEGLEARVGDSKATLAELGAQLERGKDAAEENAVRASAQMDRLSAAQCAQAHEAAGLFERQSGLRDELDGVRQELDAQKVQLLRLAEHWMSQMEAQRTLESASSRDLRAELQRLAGRVEDSARAADGAATDAGAALAQLHTQGRRCAAAESTLSEIRAAPAGRAAPVWERPVEVAPPAPPPAAPYSVAEGAPRLTAAELWRRGKATAGAEGPQQAAVQYRQSLRPSRLSPSRTY